MRVMNRYKNDERMTALECVRSQKGSWSDSSHAHLIADSNDLPFYSFSFITGLRMEQQQGIMRMYHDAAKIKVGAVQEYIKVCVNEGVAEVCLIACFICLSCLMHCSSSSVHLDPHCDTNRTCSSLTSSSSCLRTTTTCWMALRRQ